MENGQGTTSISKLPSNAQQNIITQPLQNTNNNNIVLTQNEVVAESTAQMANPMMQQIATQMPEKNQQQNHNNYNEMISQLQKANLAGVTTMPSRDIPMDPVTINNDQQIKPNFIPEPQNVDYITNSETKEDLISQNIKKQSSLDSLDSFYNEFQLPLLISVLYFLFQLPIFRKTLKKALPVLFSNDANLNLYGYFFNSILFAVIFYLLTKLINQITLNIS
tara:strand:- start:201 stop:863 length:663 start_codon:yes stop_codon:yes gene_type:complete